MIDRFGNTEHTLICEMNLECPSSIAMNLSLQIRTTSNNKTLYTVAYAPSRRHEQNFVRQEFGRTASCRHCGTQDHREQDSEDRYRVYQQMENVC